MQRLAQGMKVAKAKGKKTRNGIFRLIFEVKRVKLLYYKVGKGKLAI